MKVAYINRGEVEEPKLTKKQKFHAEIMQMIKDQEERDRAEAVEFFNKILSKNKKQKSC
jgi:hypothetical protein